MRQGLRVQMKTPPRGLILGGVEVQMLTASRKSGRLANRDTILPPQTAQPCLPSVLTKASHGAETASCRTQSVIRATLCHLRPGLKWSGQVPACRGPEYALDRIQREKGPQLSLKES